MDKIEKLKELRKELGWSQVELSNQLNIPRRTIEDWERGVRTPSEWSLDLIIEKLERIKGDGNMNEFESNYEKLLANLDKLNTSDLEDFNNWYDYEDEEREIYKAEFESKFAKMVKKYNL